MASFSKLLLSTSLSGQATLITATGFSPLTTGTTIHSGVAGSSSFDEVYLYANNIAATDAILIIQWGTVTSGNCFYNTIPAQAGRVLISDGRLINGGLSIYGLVSGATPQACSGVAIDGYINRIV